MFIRILSDPGGRAGVCESWIWEMVYGSVEGSARVQQQFRIVCFTPRKKVKLKWVLVLFCERTFVSLFDSLMVTD